LSRKVSKGLAPLDEIIGTANDEGFIEIVDDEDVIELMED